MLIATDIGNSLIKIGFFTSCGILVQRIPTQPIMTADEYRHMMYAFIKENNIEKGKGASIISSVVPSHTGILREALEGLPDQGTGSALILDSGFSGIRFQIPHPEELGTDRIANAVAAFALIRNPVIVIDFGTATTLTVVNGKGEYIGGSIMAGIGLMNQTLGMKTSKLREIDISPPDSALGKDTAGCIRSGLCIGTAGAVERIVAGIEEETAATYELLLTGGHCFLVHPFIRRPHAVRPDLTLEGLKILYEKSRSE